MRVTAGFNNGLAATATYLSAGLLASVAARSILLHGKLGISRVKLDRGRPNPFMQRTATFPPGERPESSECSVNVIYGVLVSLACGGL